MDALRERPSSARAHGDVRATLECLYVDHVRLVNAICARTLRDRTEVEDAVQQVFLSAFQALANGGRPRNSAAWLATIARNECLQRRRTPPPVALGDDDVVASDGDPAVFGDGLQVRDFTYVDDAVDATVRAVSAVSPPAILNVGGYEGATLLEIIDIVGELVGRAPQLDRRPAQRGDVRRTGADTTLARSSLGWRPTVGLRCGLAATVEWSAGLTPVEGRALTAA